MKEHDNMKESTRETTGETKGQATLKMSETGAEEVQFNLDGILSELGSFGKYQLLLLLLLAFRDSFLNMCNFNYVFTAAEVPFRCRIPGCDTNTTAYNASWAVYAVTNASVCRHPVLSGAAEHVLSTTAGYENCTADMFSSEETVACDDLVYENYNSIVAEATVAVAACIASLWILSHGWKLRGLKANSIGPFEKKVFDLGCQPWKRTLIGTVHNLGLVFSFVVSGFISDRYGRKVIIVGTPLMVGIAGLLKSISTNYWMLIVLEFLETALGYGNASMVLSLETVSHKSRVAFSCLSDILSSLGGACFGLIAWKVPYWRHMMWAIYAPLLIVVFYIFLIDEGVRWLLAHNRKAEAVRILNKVAKVNHITLSNTAKEMLAKMTEERTKADEVGSQPASNTPHILSVLKSKTIVIRMALISASFFCCMFVYSGAIINSTSISGSKYLNFSAMLLVAVPTRIITALTLTRFGRKTPICVAYCLCAIFFIASAFVPKSISWASVLFYLVGKMCSSYGIFSMSVVAMEVFPTTSRNSLTNICNTIGRLGSALAPQAPLLAQYMTGLPSIVFGVAALGPAALALALPDTSRSPLPDRIVDAENIDSRTDANTANTPASVAVA